MFRRTAELPEVSSFPLTGRSVAGERHLRLGCEVDERGSAHVHDRALDRAADERPGVVAWIVVCDRLGALPADVQSFAGERELARLGLDLFLADLLLTDVQRERSLGWHRVALPLERSREDVPAGRNRLG